MPRAARSKPSTDSFYHLETSLAGPREGALLTDFERQELMRQIKRWACLFALVIYEIDVTERGFALRCKSPGKKPAKKTVIRRLRKFYQYFYIGAKRRTKLKKLKDTDFIAHERVRLRDISEFMKNVKQCFSYWYNQRHDREGALFSGRFKSRVRVSLSQLVNKLKQALTLGLASLPNLLFLNGKRFSLLKSAVKAY